jgi:hypothetical protein
MFASLFDYMPHRLKGILFGGPRKAEYARVFCTKRAGILGVACGSSRYGMCMAGPWALMGVRMLGSPLRLVKVKSADKQNRVVGRISSSRMLRGRRRGQ